ncbi:MAG: VCBS repeat-containing protein [Verrucomicrobia bacterium]|nr:VCBS repeat-containing protein [Verrucomicrobiota bacterium]
MKTLSFFIGLILLGTPFTSFAQSPTDDFEFSAFIISTSVTGSNVGATQQPGEPTTVERPGFPRSPLGGRSVWWRWTAPESRLYTIKTGDRSGTEPSSTFDTQLGVYTGTELGNLAEVASNEDHLDFQNGLSSVTINAVQGETYHILVDGFNGETGTIVLYITETRFTLSVIVNPPGAGTVLMSPPFEVDGYVAGTTVVLQALANTGEQFFGWTGDLNTRSNIIFVVMNSNMTVRANFTADSQFIWQNTNGQVSGWSMLGTNFLRPLKFALLPPAWRLSAVSDLDGNGSGDFIFRHRDGRIAAWLMDGDIRTNNFLIGTITNGYRLVGAGNFDDGTQPDLLFQRTNGELSVWFMNDLFSTNSTSVGQVHPDWRAVTVADLNNDGRADILFQHRDGRVAVWLMYGTQRSSAVLIGTPVARLAAVRDLNHDGHPDLIFRRFGNTSAWLMNETTRQSTILVRRGLPASGSWRLVGVRD